MHVFHYHSNFVIMIIIIKKWKNNNYKCNMQYINLVFYFKSLFIYVTVSLTSNIRCTLKNIGT
jgi:hypothetical protein